MAEWLYEAGIGEARAMLIDRGDILEMVIEPEGGLRAGTVAAARLVAKADASGRGRVRLDDGRQLTLQPVPSGLTEGARLMVEVIREAYVEPGGAAKPARSKPAIPDAAPMDGPDLLTRLNRTELAIRSPGPAGEDLFEAHGWSAALEEAASGIVSGTDAMLRISLTPAMTLIDVDGAGSAAAVAVAGARAAGQVIRRFGIAGSIGIDLPTLPDRAERLAAAKAIDAVLPATFERTAVNGFGFVQIVRRRIRPSLMEMIAADPALAAARALLRRAERANGRGVLTLTAVPAVITRIESRPEWIEQLRQRVGGSLALCSDPALSISGGHAQYDHS